MNTRSENNSLSCLAVLVVILPGLSAESAHGMYDPKHGRWPQRGFPPVTEDA
jgi:hypothetical protein